MTDRVPGAPGQHKAIVTAEALQQMQAGEEFTITLRRDDQPVLEGTPYSKAAVLPDAVAAKLCPNIDDPAPKDAFDALAEGKSDGIQKRTGAALVLTDAAHTPVKGLKLFGKTTEEGSVGDSGSVTVTVEGKNIFNHLDTETSWSDVKILETGDNYVIAKGSGTSGQSSWGGGYVYFNKTAKIPCKKDVNYTISLYYTILEDPYRPSNPSSSQTYCPQILVEDTTVLTKTSGANWSREPVGTRRRLSATFLAKKDGEFYITFTLCSATMKIENIMVEVGTSVTNYVPYCESQSITVPTPGGLKSDDSARDEIDFARGVYIQNVGVTTPIETPLSAEVLASYGKLHTCPSVTRVDNDAGADMEIVYYTPSTAVQMVHSPGDAGKVLAIDQHGCVILSNHGILESGRSGNWYYRKWADGFAECWGFFDTKVSVDLGDGLGRIDLPLPVLFEKSSMRPYVQVTLERSSDGNPANIPELFDVEFNGNTLSLYITNTNATRVIPGNVYVAGLWE